MSLNVARWEGRPWWDGGEMNNLRMNNLSFLLMTLFYALSARKQVVHSILPNIALCCCTTASAMSV
jgi:hypothetical protein